MISLISTDFDGTLVDHFVIPAVSPEFLDTLREYRSQGALWAVNTGRDLDFIVAGLREFQFPEEPDFVLTSEREVFHRPTGGGEWKDYGDWNARCSAAHDELFSKAGDLLADIEKFLVRDSRAEPIYEGEKMVGLAAADDAEMDRICDFLEREQSRVPGFRFMRNTIYARFCHEDYSKGTALGELSRLTEIPRDRVFAAGDHFNDLPMLDGRHARWVACPSNAVEPVKVMVRAANGYVGRRPCSLGIADALQFFASAPQGEIEGAAAAVRE